MSQIRRVEEFELSFIEGVTVECETCQNEAVYELRLGHLYLKLCPACLAKLKLCLDVEGDDTHEGEEKIRRSVLKSWTRYFHEKVATKSFYDEFPSQLIRATIQDCGCEVLDDNGVPTDVVPTAKSGSAVFRLGYHGKIIQNAVLVVNWFDDHVHGVKGKTEINAYISY